MAHHSSFMLEALRYARRGMRQGKGGPFGACLVRNGKKVVCFSNSVISSQDPTQHAEINCIRFGARKLKRFDLSDCVLYSTTEPCPMCFSAIHWSRIRRVFFGTRILDVKRRGFNELAVSAGWLKKKGKSSVQLKAGLLRTECLRLLAEWDRMPKKRVY